MLLSVASPRRPPNVIMGVRQAKYRKMKDARHWMCNASLKSLRYQGNLRLTSVLKPPNNLKSCKIKYMTNIQHLQNDYQIVQSITQAQEMYTAVQAHQAISLQRLN